MHKNSRQRCGPRPRPTSRASRTDRRGTLGKAFFPCSCTHAWLGRAADTTCTVCKRVSAPPGRPAPYCCLPPASSNKVRCSRTRARAASFRKHSPAATGRIPGPSFLSGVSFVSPRRSTAASGTSPSAILSQSPPSSASARGWTLKVCR